MEEKSCVEETQSLVAKTTTYLVIYENISKKSKYSMPEGKMINMYVYYVC